MGRTPDSVLDELLVLRAQDGDAKAFSALVQRWQARLYRHAVRLAEDSDLAGDAVQDGWLAAARGIRRLEDPACFPRWIFQIVTRRVADGIRTKQRQRKAVESLQHELPVSHRPTEQGVDDEVSRLREAINLLPAERRELLTMYYNDGFSVAELAEIFDIPPGTVKSRLHHARQELKDIFERRGS